MKTILLVGVWFLLLSVPLVNAEPQKEIERGDNWVLYSVSGNYSFYYDKTSIKQQSKNNVRVSIREETKDAYSLGSSEIDCNNRQIGDVSVTDYDNKGNVLKSFDFKDVEMRQVKPDTLAESLYKAVCKAEKK